MTPEEAVMEYQCPGCVRGPFRTCYSKDPNQNFRCTNHTPGTITPKGKIFLGLPAGFRRLGSNPDTKIYIFESYQSYENAQGKGDIYNIYVWKYLDQNGNTIAKGLSPRTNQIFIDVFLENCLDQINCLQITDEMIQKMDP